MVKPGKRLADFVVRLFDSMSLYKQAAGAEEIDVCLAEARHRWSKAKAMSPCVSLGE